MAKPLKPPKPSIAKQIKADSDKYLKEIEAKYAAFNVANAAPVPKDMGDAYIKGHRIGKWGSPYVLRLSREAIAFLYKQMYDETVGKGKPMDGHMAVGFANYDPECLPQNESPLDNDPNWKEEKAYLSTVMLGIWDEKVGVKPFKATIKLSNNTTTVAEYYDDWHDEWP